MEEASPAGGPLLVAGGDGWTKQFSKPVWPFPLAEDGAHAGDPAGSLAAIAQLEALRARGAALLVLSPEVRWWLDEYQELALYLDRRFRRLTDWPEGALVFTLQRPRGGNEAVVSALESVIVDFESRFGRDPAILDWSCDQDLAEHLPHHAVLRPVLTDAVLPYLDRSIDLVVVESGDPIRLAEARRVASSALVVVSSGATSMETGGPSVEVEWRIEGEAPATPFLSVIVPVYQGSTDAGASLIGLAETLPPGFRGEVVLASDASISQSSGADPLSPYPSPASGEGSSLTIPSPWLPLSQRGRGGWGERGLTTVRADDLGFAAACNCAASAARGDLLLFLAGDSLPLHGWFPNLLRTFREHPEAGVVGGKLIDPHGRLREAGGMTLPDGTHTGPSEGEREADDPAYTYVREVDYASSPFLATRRDHFLELGGFDGRACPDEAVEYCRRVRARGRRVYYQPRAVIVYPVAAVRQGS